MPTPNREQMLRKLATVDQLPSLPVVVAPLLNCLQRPLDSLEINDVARLIEKDESLAAQCLHLANSPLFGLRTTVETVRSAVLALGMRRVRDIATSCSMLNLTPKNCPIDATSLWEHALGVALASRYFAQAVGFGDPDKAYLAGLLHDFGIIMNLWVAPKEFAQAHSCAASEHRPLIEAEQEILGISHTEVGRILAEKWGIPADLVQVVAYHHDVEQASDHPVLVALVSLVDLLCRMRDLGHGYREDRQIDFQDERAFQVLLEECPRLAQLDWERFTFEMEAYLEEVRRLVGLVYRRRS